MIETVIFCFSLLLVFLAAQLGMKAGAFASLIKMLAALLAFLLTMRCWYFAARLASDYASPSLPVLACFVFWSISMTVFYIILKICDSRLETFESVQPSLFGRILGAVFGGVVGLVVAAALMMTVRLLSPLVMPSYNPDALPLAVDTLPGMFYRLVETQVAGVNVDNPGHALLPNLENAASPTPAAFWQ